METESPASEHPASGFEIFALSKELQSVIKSLGYEEPTPIQRETIPHLLAGRDVLGQAATGTGKTAAFALPLVERLEGNPRLPFSTRALVLVPTRELCMQVAEAIRTYGQHRRLVVAAVFGGQEIFHQVKLLKTGVDVVVATPGRVLDHVRRKTLKLGGVRFVVLDEADEMLDMGFADDLELILKELPENRQTALFSATMAPRIATIANAHLDNPIRVTIAPRSVESGTIPNIRQAAYLVRRDLKESALIRLLDVEAPSSALIFCRTRIEVEALTESLGRRGLLVAALHGGMTQEQRDITLRRFKGGELKMLIATDVAARGLHVENLSHVINYDLPVSPEPYVHRIGRTGRAGREGVALSLLDPRELRLLKNIERTTRTKIPMEKLPGIEAMRKKREGVLAELVRGSLQPATVEQMKGLLAALSRGTTVEAVASAALQVAMARLFPPTDGDDVDFAAPAPARKPFTGQEENGRARGGRSDRPGGRSEGPRGRTAPFERSFGGESPRSAGPRREPAERRPFAGSDAGPRSASRKDPAERRPSNGGEPEAAPRKDPAERRPFSGDESAAPRSAPRKDPTARRPFTGDEPEAPKSSPRKDSTERRPFTGDEPEAPKSSPRKDPTARKPFTGDEPEAPKSAPRKDPTARRPFTGDEPEAPKSAPRRAPEEAPAPHQDPAERRDDAAPRARVSAPRGAVAERTPVSEEPAGRPAPHRPYDKTDTRRPPRGADDVVTLFIGLGTRAGLRPQDVVGAIANEAGISSRDIGNIVIGDEHSRVQVPQDAATEIIAALKQTTLRGRKFTIDFDRAPAGGAARPSDPAAPSAFKKDRFISSKPPRAKK